MKARTQVLALMVALAAGSAAAASAGTTAGTGITNTATATFTDPTTGNAATPVTSNTVTTTVLPITGFDVTYSDGSTDGTSASTPAASYDKTGVLPGSKVSTTYTVLNNSNINNYVVNIAPDTTGSATALPAANVTYYLATDTTFTTPITSVTLANGAQVNIVQVIAIPTTAAVGAQYSASPHGNAPAGNVSGIAYAAVDESTNLNPPATTPINSDLEFTRATIFTPTVVNFPTVPTTPANPTTPSTPGTNTVTPPTTANPGTANSPVSPPGTTGAATDPSTPGYTDPTQTPTAANPGTAIAVLGNSQIAYPPADADANNDVVTFSNVVSTPVNAATPADTISLFPTNATGNPIGTNNGNGTFTVPAIGGNPAYTISFTTAPANGTAGTPLGTATNAADGKVYPVVTIPAGGGSAAYRTVITYADSNPNTNTTTADDPLPVVVLVGADSGNDADILANGTTTDTIYPAAAAFGDVPATGTAANRNLIGPGNVAQAVVPGTAAATGAPSATILTDSTAVFPMVINNTGEYNDTYLLTGSVPVKLADGTTKYVAVIYVDATGTELPKNTSGVDAQGNTLPATLTGGTPAVYYQSPLVNANSNATVYAVVNVPATAAATTGTTGLNPNPVLTQSAKGNYSTILLTDINDQIKIGSIGSITLAKTQKVAAATSYTNTAANAKPGDAISYQIIATNTYNSPVFNFKLIDNNAASNAFTYTNFVSSGVVLTGFTGQTPPLASVNVYYSVDGGTTFTTTAPTPATVTAANGIQVAIDTDNSGTITAADQVPANATITLTINTTVK